MRKANVSLGVSGRCSGWRVEESYKWGRSSLMSSIDLYVAQFGHCTALNKEAGIRHTAWLIVRSLYHSITADKLRRGADGGIHKWERQGIFSPRGAARATVPLLRRTAFPQ